MTLADTIAQQLAAADKRDMTALKRIIDEHTGMVRRLLPYQTALINRIIAESKDGEVSRAQIERMGEYRDLVREFGEEMDDYSRALISALKNDTDGAVRLGGAAGLAILAASIGVKPAQLRQVDFDAVVQAVLSEYFGAGSPLVTKARNLKEYYGDLLKQIVLEGVASGRNPLTIAKQIVESVYGMSLTDAMRWTRTSQLYGYRWATLQTYEQNGVQAWIWQANLDAKTCMSCIALHGKVFPTSDGIANDHYNGRCYMVPLVPGYTDQLANPTAGREWFEQQTPEQQRAQMGAGKYDAWQNGKIEFDNLTTLHDDDTFGTMRTEPSLKELTNGQ